MTKGINFLDSDPPEPSVQLREQPRLLDVQTGEVLPATIANAARALYAARAMKARINEVVADTTAYLVEISEHQGTKTLHDEGETITVTGGPSIDYIPTDLIEALEAAGCPENRISAAVETVISYKVDRAVLRQLAGSNLKYKHAITGCEIEVEKPYRASVKQRSNRD